MMQTPQATSSPAAGDEAASHVLFDEAQVQRLAEVYAPCFALILQLRGTDEYGDAQALRARILDLFDKADREAKRAGTSERASQQAQFALVAFVDETILSSNWVQKDYWLAKPLQLELYDRYDAGEEFFERLKQLRAEGAAQAEVLEIYYLCMTLGFKGRYLLHDQEKLRTLVEETHDALRSMPGMQAEQLSPHGTPGDQTATEVRSKLPPWVIAVAALVLGLLVYLGMSLYISDAAGDAVQSIGAMTSGRSG